MQSIYLTRQELDTLYKLIETLEIESLQDIELTQVYGETGAGLGFSYRRKDTFVTYSLDDCIFSTYFTFTI